MKMEYRRPGDPDITELTREFLESPFTTTPSYEHYAAEDASVKAARDAHIADFLQDSRLPEPSNMMNGRYSAEFINDTIVLYNKLSSALLSKERTLEEEDLLDKLVAKTGELFRYEELMLALGAVAIEDRDEHRRLASDLSVEIMGGVNQRVFHELINELIYLAKQSDLAEADQLLELVSEDLEAETSFTSMELEDATIEAIREDLGELYPGLQRMIKLSRDEPVSPSEALIIFRELQSIAHVSPEWRTELGDGKSARTSAEKKTVYIGKERNPFRSEIEAIGVGFHEAVVHAQRSEGIRLFNGLDFEEGLATCLEQVITGKKRTPGKQYYLSIGLQAGADQSGRGRNYRETFEIMWRRELLLMEQRSEEIDVIKARSDAQRQVHRTRRGGAIDTRDSAYFIGAQKATDWLNEIARLPKEERRHLLELALSNGIDPTKPEHKPVWDKMRYNS